MPDPHNPRTLPGRPHPFTAEPGHGAEDSEFRPVAEPRTPSGVAPEIAFTEQWELDADDETDLAAQKLVLQRRPVGEIFTGLQAPQTAAFVRNRLHGVPGNDPPSPGYERYQHVVGTYLIPIVHPISA